MKKLQDYEQLWLKYNAKHFDGGGEIARASPNSYEIWTRSEHT